MVSPIVEVLASVSEVEEGESAVFIASSYYGSSYQSALWAPRCCFGWFGKFLVYISRKWNPANALGGNCKVQK